jgi:SAM-dependent methyltransferase
MDNFFFEAYAGTPPWDIGKPQDAFIQLEESGEITGDVLDAGCGTGENALLLASRGLQVCGIDREPIAIDRARKKAAERSIPAKFHVLDALQMSSIGRTFDTVIDSGLFHVFSDAERQLFVRNLETVTLPGSRYFMLCFSEREPGGWGPRRVTESEIRKAFSKGWIIHSIHAARFNNRLNPEDSKAWLSSIMRE